MRKITLLIASLFIAIGAMAQFEDGKKYRLKVVGGPQDGKYVTIGDESANTHGHVYVNNLDSNSSDQKFQFISVGEGKFKIKSDADEYFAQVDPGAGWNVNSSKDESEAMFIIFEPVNGSSNEYYLRKDYNSYFKVGPVNDNASPFYHVYHDGDNTSKATFVVEEVVSQLYSIVYNYTLDGTVVMSKTYQVNGGDEYPDLLSGLYQVTVNGTKPSGPVSENGEFDFSVTIGEMPFEYYESYEAVEEANGWYNLVMHSNHGNEARFRTYVGVGEENATTLAWGTNRALRNASDKYYWAFVGDPINGFRVVNKDKGEGWILSSDGSKNPIMHEEANLAENYNKTWQIAARSHNSGDWVQDGDWFCLKYRDSWYMNANSANGQVNFWNVDDNGSGILAVKPITINKDADYATYFAKTSFTIPGTLGAEVYYVNNVENGYAKFEQITGVVYSETGVVVKFDTDDNVTYAPEFVSPGTATVISDNLLKGTTKKTLFVKENNKAYYALGLVEGVVGFYNAVNGDNENEFYNGAFKAYLELPTSQSTAAFYGFNFDETTGVEEVEVESTVKTIYDLSGRKVSGMSAPGLYIVNGKKVLVK